MAVRIVKQASCGAVLTWVALGWIRRDPGAGQLERTNFRGRSVTLAAGPALASGATLAAALAAPSLAMCAAVVSAGFAAGTVGFYDDIVGSRAEQKAAKGFAGHLAALRNGRLTSGLVKLVGVGVGALAAAALLATDASVRAHRDRRGAATPARVLDVLLGAGVIAGTANLINLFDLRPGRAVKVGLLLGVPLTTGPASGLAAGPLGASLAVLPADLNEDVMLGDAGANALGALLGVALAVRGGPVGRAAALAVLLGLTAASEKVSFTKVIEYTPGLRELDRLGRRQPTVR